MPISGNGRMLGRYQLLFLLGQGGMGEVHLARLTGAAGFEKLCIVKTVLPNLMGDQSFIDRFHHEARVLVQLSHSNIAQVYDMGELAGSLYMAIEYVSGVDLSRVESRVARQQAVMPIPMAVYIGQQVCEALGYAHRKVGADGMPLGIVHRDVSPQNVMVSYEGEVKVIDFGLAKSAARSKQTLPSTVMGKLGYMSPEQAVAKNLDHRSDIFSAGIVIWEMLAGRSMYHGGTMAEMVVQMAMAEVPSLTQARPGISPALDQIVMRALAKDPAARYQRADDFARALNELAVREQLTVGAEEVGNYVRAMCPEEFAAERQLQSQLSLMRKAAAASEGSPPFDGTFLRPAASEAAPKETASGQAMTPAQRAMSVVQTASPSRGVTPSGVDSGPARSRGPETPSNVGEEPLVLPKSRTPLLIAGLVAFIALAGAVLSFLGDGDDSKPVPPPALVAELRAPPEPVKPRVEPEPKGPAVQGPEPAASSTPVVLTTVMVQGKVWKVLEKGDEAFMILDKHDKLLEGDRVNLVGEPDEAGKRPVYARAAVLSVKGSVASLIFDEDVALPERIFAAKDDSPSRVISVPRKERAEVVKASAEPERPSRETAQASPQPAKASPEPAKASPEASKPPAAPADPAKPPLPDAAKAPAQLFGTLTISRAERGQRTVIIRSQNNFNLTQCEIRLPGNMVYRTEARMVLPNEEIRVALRQFRRDPRAPDPQFLDDWAAVYCREGTGYWKTSYAR